LSNDL